MNPDKNLETFLRGMETMSRARAKSTAPGALKPSLEGWKQGSDVEGLNDAESLKPSLEGWKLFHPEPKGS